MAQIVVRVDDFKLTSTYRCVTYDVNYLNPDTNFQTVEQVVTKKTTETAKKASKTVTFAYTLPEGMKAVGAQVHATLGKTSYGAASSTINGVSVGTECEAVVDVTLDAESSSVAVPFSFTTKKVTHDHTWDGYMYRSGYYIEQGIYAGTHFAYDHSASLEYRDVYLVIEYVIDNQGWTLTPNVVKPGDTMTVDLEEVKAGYTYTAQAIIGDYGTEEQVIPLVGSMCGENICGEALCGVANGQTTFEVPYDWLYAIPDSITGSGVVILRAYLNGACVGESEKSFALVCPDSAKPSFMLFSHKPLETVDGVTYPQLANQTYVQNKCGVHAQWGGVAAKYGATIVSQHINVGGYEGGAYNKADAECILSNQGNVLNLGIKSGLLTVSGYVPVTLTVMDSRGLKLEFTQTIYVHPYEPPSVADFTAWRVNAEGVVDKLGAYGMCSFVPSCTDHFLNNTLTATLTIDGQSETFEVTKDEKNTCWLFPSSHPIFADDVPYAVELTLTDRWESVTFKAVTLRPVTGTTVVIRPTRKKKRGLIIGEYDTVLDGDWTVASLSFPEPEQQTNFVKVPGRTKGPIDMSTVLTDGEPTYDSRLLSAKLENSSGTRKERNELIRRMVNQLNGRRWQIIHPDYPDHYLVGRVALKTEYSDMAHCAVSVTATCEPWLYNKLETEIAYTASSAEKEGVLPNMGGLALIPTVTVTDGSVTLSCEGKSWALTEGSYNLPELILYPGDTYITYSGEGVISFVYREAVL